MQAEVLCDKQLSEEGPSQTKHNESQSEQVDPSQ